MCSENEVSTAASIGPTSAMRSTPRPAKKAQRRTRGARNASAGLRGRARPRQSRRRRPRRRRAPRSDQPTVTTSIALDHHDVRRHSGGEPDRRSPTTGSRSRTSFQTPPGAVDVHRAAVGLDDRLDDGQSEAEAARVPAPTRLRPGEPIEDLVQVRGRDPGARVADPDRGPCPTRCTPTSIVSVSLVCCTAFSITASSATASRSASHDTVASSTDPVPSAEASPSTDGRPPLPAGGR